MRYLGIELPHSDAPAVALNQAKIHEYHPATWYNKLALLKGRYADGWLDTTELDCTFRCSLLSIRGMTH